MFFIHHALKFKQHPLCLNVNDDMHDRQQ